MSRSTGLIPPAWRHLIGVIKRMSRSPLARFFINFLAISGIPLMALIALGLMNAVVQEIRYTSWRNSLEKSGTMAVAEEQIRFLEAQYKTSGQYPCDLPEDKQDRRLRYRKTYDSYYIFIPIEGSPSKGLIYHEKQWGLCAPSGSCPPGFDDPRCHH